MTEAEVAAAWPSYWPLAWHCAAARVWYVRRVFREDSTHDAATFGLLRALRTWQPGGGRSLATWVGFVVRQQAEKESRWWGRCGRDPPGERVGFDGMAARDDVVTEVMAREMITARG